MIMVWNDHRGDPRSVIQEIEAAIAEFGRAAQAAQQRQLPAEQYLYAPSWSDINSKFYRLSYFNRETARSRAMLYLNQNPEQSYSSNWYWRFQDARRPWDYFESSERVERAVIACVVSLLICTILGWLIPLLTSWIWYFFLDRLREFVTAIRGQS